MRKIKESMFLFCGKPTDPRSADFTGIVTSVSAPELDLGLWLCIEVQGTPLAHYGTGQVYVTDELYSFNNDENLEERFTAPHM